MAAAFFGQFYSFASDGSQACFGACLVVIAFDSIANMPGLNSIRVYTVVDEAFSSCFGFTMQEVGLLFGNDQEKIAKGEGYV